MGGRGRRKGKEEKGGGAQLSVSSRCSLWDASLQFLSGEIGVRESFPVFTTMQFVRRLYRSQFRVRQLTGMLVTLWPDGFSVTQLNLHVLASDSRKYTNHNVCELL